MAALVCQSFAKLCNALGECVSLPFKLCGDTVGKILCSPFLPYLAITMALNFPPLFWSMQDRFRDCDATSSWLLINGILSLVHILASFYIVYQIQRQQKQPEQSLKGSNNDDDGEKGSPVKPAIISSSSTSSYYRMEGNHMWTWRSHHIEAGPSSAANSISRYAHVLCYDIGVAIYILLAAFWILWLTVGMSQAVRGNEDNVNGCHEEKWVVFSIILGYVYLSLVCVAFSCSMICM